MRIKNLLIKISTYLCKHTYIIKGIVMIAIVIPLLDLKYIANIYIQLFKLINTIMSKLTIPVIILTIIGSIIYTIIWLKNNDK